jgi:hypothetical protein
MFKFSKASKEEAHWRLTDEKGFKYRMFFSFYSCTSEEYNATIYGLIIGKYFWRWGKIHKENT